ncbi:hypothetical protein EHC70_06960 [Vibrio parahaemolyticus]|nr:hypothetical protein EHC70_06960 [Vibrio parahaemolyticus]
MLSERRNHIPFVLSEVRVSHVFYFLAGANFMIIAFHCFYVQRCRTSYLNPSRITKHLRVIRNACRFRFAQSIGKPCSHLNAALALFEETIWKSYKK